MSAELLPLGVSAPTFEAEASDGRRYALRVLLEAGPVVLFFYPGDDTPG